MFDVIIVGAGPAGLVSAYRLLEEGFNILILEKEIKPNYNKLCAGYIPSEVFEKYNIPKQIADHIVDRIKIVADKNEWVIDFYEEVGYNVDRNKFAEFLASRVLKTGGVIETSSFVKKFIEKDFYVSVIVNDKEYSSKIVILSDGVCSRMAALIRGRYQSNNLGIAIQAKVNLNNHFLKNNSKLNVILFGNLYSPFGYGWVFPKKTYLDVGLGTLVSKAKGKKLEDYLANILEYFTLEKSSPRFYPVPLSGPLTNIARNRILLAGDNAGHVSPLTGEGIKYSMYAGDIAAETIIEYLKNRINIKDIRDSYLKKLKKSFYKKLRIEKLILSLLVRKSFSALKILENKETRRLIAEIYADRYRKNLILTLLKRYIMTYV